MLVIAHLQARGERLTIRVFTDMNGIFIMSSVSLRIREILLSPNTPGQK